MDQIIKERVESGERMLVIVADKQGELQFQGNDQVVEEVTQDQELMDRLKLSFNRPGAEGYGYEYRRFAKFVLPRSAVKIRGKGWASNVVSDYLRVLLKTLCDAGMLKKRFYGKGLAPSWYPADLKWEEFGKVSNKGTQEQKTKICEAILTYYEYNPGNHYTGWEEDVRREEEAREAREAEEVEREAREEQERDRALAAGVDLDDEEDQDEDDPQVRELSDQGDEEVEEEEEVQVEGRGEEGEEEDGEGIDNYQDNNSNSEDSEMEVQGGEEEEEEEGEGEEREVDERPTRYRRLPRSAAPPHRPDFYYPTP